MKKILSLIMALSLTFIACGNTDDDDDDVTPIETKETTQNAVPQETTQNVDSQETTQNIDPQTNTENNMNKMFITVNGKTLTADLADNSSAKALAEALANSPITYKADDYGNFEKVGDLGMSFPQNNENITTEPGDIILYQGHNLCIYYAQNTWNFTRIAKINGISQKELKDFLGDGEITVTLSVEK